MWTVNSRYRLGEMQASGRTSGAFGRTLASLLAAMALIVMHASDTSAATGDAAFLAGADTIQPSTDGKTATVNIAGIQNTTNNTVSGSLGFELWYSATPYSGGTLTGYEVASSFLPIGQCTASTLQPGASCTSIRVQATVTTPPAGTYYPVLVLVEHAASCTSANGFCIDDFVPLVSTVDGSSTITVGSGGGSSPTGSQVSIVGSYSYLIDPSAGTATLSLDEILNSSPSTTTGTLRLELWLTDSTYTGGTINGNRIATYQMTNGGTGQLGPGQVFSSIAATTNLSALPAAGTYQVSLLVTEYSASCTASDHFCIDTYGNFSTPYIVTGNAAGVSVSSVSMDGTYSYVADQTAGSVSLAIAKIVNSSTTRSTGTLRMELWLTDTPYAGGTITGNRIATSMLTSSNNGTLGPNQEFDGVSASASLVNLPNAGNYYATLIVSEYTNACGSSDGYCIDAYGGFSNQFNVVSTADTSGGGGSSGGGGALGWAGVGGLAGLALLRGLRRTFFGGRSSERWEVIRCDMKRGKAPRTDG